MRISKVKLGLVAATAVSAAMPLLATPAFADYAPTTSDVVGVGSDTVQYASDFVDDGDYAADAGFNSAGAINKVVNFDATPDANARLAYGNYGAFGPTGTLTACPPGTGSFVGSGNTNANQSNGGKPCVLNPTVVLRAGTRPVQRVNGSGAGGSAGAADTGHLIDYVRASSAQGANLKANGVTWDSITIGTDNLDILTATTTNAVPLSSAQLYNIYSCVDTTWASVGSTGPNAGQTIIPIIPQAGSGTRSSFLNSIGSPTLGSCVVTGEENDPYAIGNATAPANAIEPMSSGRLNLFQGVAPGQAANAHGYFQDPSCTVEATTPTACTTGIFLNPAVTLVTTGTPSTTGAATVTGVNNNLYGVPRNLYIYFRDSDVNSATPLNVGSTLNFVRTLFYNPCSGAGCTGFGPGGAPYYDTSFGQTLIEEAGITPTYAFTAGGA